MQIDCSSFSCAECCNRYWIMLLPGETKTIAKFLKKTKKQFFADYCAVQVQLFPAAKKKNNLFVSSEKLPKKTRVKIQRELGSVSSFFLALPSIVLRRRNNVACVFLNSKGKCAIYSVRPGPCQLFPLIPHQGKPLHELYPFCVFLQEKKSRGTFAQRGKLQFKKTADYFDSVEKKGFKKIWKAVPKTAFVQLDSQYLGTISSEQFFNLYSRPAKRIAR